jgi:hypothetical protein
METPYKEAFPVGARVRIGSRAVLGTFARDWKLHHPLQPEQMKYAGTQATVKSVGFYHGGDVIYVLESVSGTWHETCLEPAQ